MYKRNYYMPEKHLKLIAEMSTLLNIPEAEVVRNAVESYCTGIDMESAKRLKAFKDRYSIVKEIPNPAEKNLLRNLPYHWSGPKLKITPDHLQLFEAKDGTRYLTNQPYDLTEDDIAIAQASCDKAGLKILEVSRAESWHYPGGTTLMIITVGDEIKFRQWVKEHRDRY